MEFCYKGLSPSGVKVKETIEASTIEEAKKILKVQGIIYSEVAPYRPSFFATLSLFSSHTLPSALLATFSRDLAVYLKAGIPLVRALGLMKNQNRGNSQKERFFESLITAIHEGKSFAQALESQDVYTLPVFYTGTLKISQDRGILGAVLEELSNYLLTQEKISKQISQAMVYPAFIVVISFFMIMFMLSVVVPKITSVFETTGQALPTLTQLVIDLSLFFSHYWAMILVGMMVIVATVTIKLKSDYRFKRAVHKMMLALPIVGKVIETGDLARFSTISALLIRSGVPIVNTLKLSSITLSSVVIREVFQYVTARVVEGESLYKALQKNPIYAIDTAFVEAIAIGEETSEVASMLEHLCDLYVQANKDKITVFLSVLEPALMLIIGSIIGVIVTAMLLPIFSLNLG
jgi:type II secretory pathway component PulF